MMCSLCDSCGWDEDVCAWHLYCTDMCFCVTAEEFSKCEPTTSVFCGDPSRMSIPRNVVVRQNLMELLWYLFSSVTVIHLKDEITVCCVVGLSYRYCGIWVFQLLCIVYTVLPHMRWKVSIFVIALPHPRVIVCASHNNTAVKLECNTIDARMEAQTSRKFHVFSLVNIMSNKARIVPSGMKKICVPWWRKISNQKRGDNFLSVPRSIHRG